MFYGDEQDAQRIERNSKFERQRVFLFSDMIIFASKKKLAGEFFSICVVEECFFFFFFFFLLFFFFRSLNCSLSLSPLVIVFFPINIIIIIFFFRREYTQLGFSWSYFCARNATSQCSGGL
jgi:hypothetical protein